MKVGSKAPNFNLPDKSGKLISLKDLDGEYNVVYFYPKDNTPGCTIQAQELTGALPQLAKLKTKVIGISGGDTKSKTKFCKENKLKVTLLSDSTNAIAKKFGAFGTKKFMGRSVKGIKRMTFLLDKKGKVVKVFDKVKPETHAEEILKTITSFLKGATTKSSSLKNAKRRATPKLSKVTAGRKKAASKRSVLKQTPARKSAAKSKKNKR